MALTDAVDIVLLILSIMVALAVVYMGYALRNLRRSSTRVAPSSLLSEDSDMLASEKGGITLGDRTAAIVMEHGLEINPDELIVKRCIGIGTRGKVYRAQYRGLPVVSKVLTKNDSCPELRRNPNAVEDALEPLFLLRHPSLVLFMGLSKPSPDKVVIVSEYLAKGSLVDVLRDGAVELSWSQRIGMASNIAQAMAYLHGANPPLVHHKLSSSNVLVSETLAAKVADYGLARIDGLITESNVVVPPPWWTAPEILEGGKGGPEADVYSFGVVAWEIITRRVPFADQRFENHVAAIRAIKQGARPTLPSSVPTEACKLLRSCWAPRPADRPPFEEVVQHLGIVAQLAVHDRDLPSVVRSTAAASGSSAEGQAEKAAAERKEEARNANDVAAVIGADLFIQPEELVLGKSLGVGSFGEVFEATFRGKDVAVKRLKSSTVDRHGIDQFLHELGMMCGLRHPNVVLFMGASCEGETLSIVMEHCSKGSLSHFLQDKSNHLDYSTIVRILQDVAEGMNYLHLASVPILHRDLKSLNILVDDNMTAKVSDFGLTQFKSKEPHAAGGNLGTPFWLAPEAMEREEFTEKSDIYSFGVVCWEMFARVQPFTGMNPHQVALAVIADDVRPPIPPFVPPRVRRLIEHCWARDPLKRPSFSQIIEALKIIRREGLPRSDLTVDNASFYSKKTLVYAFPCRDRVVVTKPWGTGQSKPGDWIIVGPEDDVYTCDRAIFETTYIRDGPEPNQHRKTGKILARRMEEAFMIETLEGTEHGEPGDYLAQNPVDGEQWPISAAVFEQAYALSQLQSIEPDPPVECKRVQTSDRKQQDDEEDAPELEVLSEDGRAVEEAEAEDRFEKVNPKVKSVEKPAGKGKTLPAQ